MKAIQTRYFGPSNVRGSRVKAWAEGGNSITISYDSAMGHESHDAAALALCAKMGWEGDLIRGGSPDERGNVYVFADPCEFNTLKNPTVDPRRGCAHCGHVCPKDLPCKQCGGDPMESGDTLCVYCSELDPADLSHPQSEAERS